MGAGRYIGRVGALAVALGVGTAVGSGYGLAWADTTGTSESTSSSSESSSTSGSTDTGSKSTTGESTTTGATTGATTGSTTGSTSTGTTTSTGGSTTSDSDSTTSSTTGTTSTSTSGTQTTTGSTTSVTTGSGSSTDPKSTLSAQGVVEGSTTESHTTSQPTSTSPTTTVEKPTETTVTTPPTPSPTPTPEPKPQAQQTVPDNKSSSTTQSSSAQQQTTTATATMLRVPTTTLSAVTEPTAASVTAPTAPAKPLVSQSLVTALPSPAPTPVYLLSPMAIPPPVSPPSLVARAVTSLLSVFGIDLLAGTTPVAPAQSPLLWGLLGWVRRQLAGAVPSTPQIPTMTTSLFTAQPVGALSLDPAPIVPAATADAVQPTELDAAAPTTLDAATPATFAVEESSTVDATSDPTADPTALDTAAPMMMAAAAEPVALAATAPTTFALEESSTVDATSDPTADPTALDTAAPMMMAAAVEPVALAAIAPAPAFPAPGAQLSPSTNFISWLTGNFPDNYTLSRFGINGTDVGIIWDNGMVDDPSTPYNEHQLLIAFGDTFGDPNAPGQQWRSNVLLRTSDLVLSDGLSIPNGTVINAADLSTYFGGAPLAYVNFAKQIINDPNVGPAVTIIPTAAISVPTPGTMFGVTQYINFMAVQQWGNPGYWTTSYSAIAYSQDNGQNWTFAPSTVRLNQWWTGNQNFQQASYLRPGDGYVYMYGTPNGRQGNAYLARVAEQSMLDLTKYQYWNGNAAAVPGQPGPAGQWITGNPAAATSIFPVQQVVGACGALSRGPGSTTSEMSVQYNAYLKKYIAMYTDQNNSVVMRTSDLPQGAWSYAKVLMNQQPGGIYAPMMNPWSPSTKGTGSDLYWNLSLFNTYDVMNMRTDLSKVN